MDGAINKGSKMITQAWTPFKTKTGRRSGILIINADCQRAPAERDDIMTDDAKQLLINLQTIVVPTPALFDVWLLSQSDPTAAAKKLKKLWTAPAGVRVP